MANEHHQRNVKSLFHCIQMRNNKQTNKNKTYHVSNLMNSSGPPFLNDRWSAFNLIASRRSSYTKRHCFGDAFWKNAKLESDGSTIWPSSWLSDYYSVFNTEKKWICDWIFQSQKWATRTPNAIDHDDDNDDDVDIDDGTTRSKTNKNKFQESNLDFQKLNMVMFK